LDLTTGKNLFWNYFPTGVSAEFESFFPTRKLLIFLAKWLQKKRGILGAFTHLRYHQLIEMKE